MVDCNLLNASITATFAWQKVIGAVINKDFLADLDIAVSD